MVGRDAELAALLDASEAVKAGMGRIGVISGEPGLGKTRLISEWQAAAISTDELNIMWATGQGLSYGQGLAYYLLIDMLHALIGMPSAAAELEMRAALHLLSDDLFGDSAPEIYPYLGHLLSLHLEDEALASLRRLLQQMATRQPLGLIFEDIHYGRSRLNRVNHKIDAVEIPDNLQSLLLARIDRLPDEIKHTLRVASVIGRQFSVRVLDEVLQGV